MLKLTDDQEPETFFLGRRGKKQLGLQQLLVRLSNEQIIILNYRARSWYMFTYQSSWDISSIFEVLCKQELLRQTYHYSPKGNLL